MNITIPIRVVSEANQREHWARKHRRKKEQQKAVFIALAVNKQAKEFLFLKSPTHLLGITLKRFGPGIMDSDNLAGAFKHVRDAIAKFYGFDDGDTSKATWEYSQERARNYWIEVDIQCVVILEPLNKKLIDVIV